MVEIHKSGLLSVDFIFSHEKFAIQLFCFCYNSLDILHDLVGIILLPTLDAFQTRDILYPTPARRLHLLSRVKDGDELLKK